MRLSTIDAHGIANPRGKVPLPRIVKAIPMERLRLLMMGVVVLATGVILLTGGTNRTSTVELFVAVELGSVGDMRLS